MTQTLHGIHAEPLGLLLILVVATTLDASPHDSSCSVAAAGQHSFSALLQATVPQKAISSQMASSTEEQGKSPELSTGDGLGLPLREGSLIQMANSSMPTSMLGCETNPSGELAPLNQLGYYAVKTRCCKFEVMQYIRRVVESLNLEVCLDGGVVGIAPYHSCGSHRQYSDLTNDIQRDASMRCTWVSAIGACQPRPVDCPDFSGLPAPTDCQCSRADNTALNFQGPNKILINNLGGTGALGTSGPQELRLGSVGTGPNGQPFDLVVTALNTYERGDDEPSISIEKFVNIFVAGGVGADFRFTFMEAGTHNPVQLKQVMMTFYDLDGVPSNYEELYVTGYTGYVTDRETMLTVDRAQDGRTKFSQSTTDVVHPMGFGLLPSMRKAAVMFFFKDKSSFDVSFFNAPFTGIPVPSKQRRMMFGGSSELEDRCGP